MAENQYDKLNHSPKHIKKEPELSSDSFSEGLKPSVTSESSDTSVKDADHFGDSGFYDYVVSMHHTNKRALRDGYIALLVLPFILIVFMNLIDGDRVVFLLVWIVCMFALAAFLIFVAYSDHRMQKIMANLTLNRESLGELMDVAEAEARVREIIRQRRSLIWSLRDRAMHSEEMFHPLKGKALHKEDKDK